MDYLGNELKPGSIVVMSGTRESGFRFGVVEKVGKGRVYLTSSYPSRKESDNVIEITEEQLLQSVTSKLETRANDEGNIVAEHYDRRANGGRGGRVTVVTPIQEKIYDICSMIIAQSRFLKGEPLGEYGELQEEVEQRFN